MYRLIRSGAAVCLMILTQPLHHSLYSVVVLQEGMREVPIIKSKLNNKLQSTFNQCKQVDEFCTYDNHT